MTSEEAGFLQAIHADPLENGPRMAYADWLEQHEDPRAEYLRTDCKASEAHQRLMELRLSLDSEWIRQMSRRCSVRMVSIEPGMKLDAIMMFQNLTQSALAESRSFVDREPERRVIRDNLTREEAQAWATRFEGVATIVIEPAQDPIGDYDAEPPRQINGPYRVRLVCAQTNHLSTLVRLVQQVTGHELPQAREIVASPGENCILRDALSVQEAEDIAQQFRGIAFVMIESPRE